MRVKGLKTKYNNEELGLRIRRYVFEHLQNLDIVLADLEQADVTIAEAKSQFCWTGLKIVGYIWNVDGCHLDTSKVLRIFDWPEYTHVTSACAIGVDVYYRIWNKDIAQVASLIYHLFKTIYRFYGKKNKKKQWIYLNWHLQFFRT